jgi:hypothetical protein
MEMSSSPDEPVERDAAKPEGDAAGKDEGEKAAAEQAAEAEEEDVWGDAPTVQMQALPDDAAGD